MGLHSLMNQDQFHASQSEKAPRADPDVGWKGVTKATPLKVSEHKGGLRKLWLTQLFAGGGFISLKRKRIIAPYQSFCPVI